ncbi:MAG: hypothetical protein ACKOTE_16685 [Opitutaceae bacterium]
MKPLTFLRSLRSINLHLWDEQARRLVSFADLRRSLRASPAPQPAV